MSPDFLVDQFGRISDAPDAVARLRRFILDLAVRGKLVPQEKRDKTASELLTAIVQERARLENAGAIKKSDVDPIGPNEGPFAIPDSWSWTRLGVVGDWGSGSTPPRSDSGLYGGGITWLKSGELEDNRQLRGSEETVTDAALVKGSFRLNRSGDVLIAMYGATIGKAAILAEEAVTNQAVCGCTPLTGVFNRYLFLFLISQREGFRSASEGGAQPNISKRKIVNTPFPLPPLAEQHRIVAKLDELMALCDELEAAQAKRESRRDRLVAATLHGLNSGDSGEGSTEAFQQTARFYFNHLPRLTTKPEHIRQLRQIILNLAVRGKLVPQDPSDEPASVLLARIRAGQERSSGRKSASRDESSNGPFRLPTGWEWSGFQELGAFGRGKSKHRPRNDASLFEGGVYPFVQTGDVARSRGLVTTFTSKYNDKGLEQSAMWPRGTLCITIAANIAETGILDFDACFPDSVVGFIPASVMRDARYFEYFMRTARANLQEFAPATAQKNINLAILNELQIPLPPLTEQHRIVAKVDELMALCDGLGGGLDDIAETRRGLLEATLQEALGT